MNKPKSSVAQCVPVKRRGVKGVLCVRLERMCLENDFRTRTCVRSDLTHDTLRSSRTQCGFCASSSINASQVKANTGHSCVRLERRQATMRSTGTHCGLCVRVERRHSFDSNAKAPVWGVASLYLVWAPLDGKRRLRLLWVRGDLRGTAGG